ncbi:GlxA family transcriptional regulator [uncultured Jatrophihabitans sp.]|uniref:GlxA family transcriptional regulator n=1 Tax=uncultured Jatrophihabitans sp. TaxID=1610747 RepID=UPI0035CC0B53
MTRTWRCTPPAHVDHRRRVGIVVFDGVKMLDLAGPAEVFVEATGDAAGYDLVFLSPDGAEVTTSIGARVAVECAAAEGGRFDTVIIPGSDQPPATFLNDRLLGAVQALAMDTRRLVSICSGAFLLAELGLLDGRRATTHWKHTAELARRFPAVKVDPDSIWVRDGCVYTSAGVAAGIDLALALVEEDLGADAARHAARTLLVYMRRAGGQTQFSTSLQGPAPRSAAVTAVVDLVRSDLSHPYTVQDLARYANVSTRSLTRLFRSELEVSPAEYLAMVRFGFARDMLDAGHSVTGAAIQAGYGSSETMRRAFVDRLGISPRTYQRRFSSTT